MYNNPSPNLYTHISELIFPDLPVYNQTFSNQPHIMFFLFLDRLEGSTRHPSGHLFVVHDRAGFLYSLSLWYSVPGPLAQRFTCYDISPSYQHYTVSLLLCYQVSVHGLLDNVQYIQADKAESKARKSTTLYFTQYLGVSFL